MRKYILILLYFFSGAGCIMLEIVNRPLAAVIPKGLIIPVLAIFYIAATKPLKRLNWHILAALFFSWIGDIILQFTILDDSLFMMGLGAFLLTQIIYAETFFSIPGRIEFRPLAVFSLLLLIYGITLISILYNGLGTLKFPVLIYALMILTMAAGAFSRFGKVGKRSFDMVLIGALFFLLSDSLIAFNKFRSHIPAGSVWIMVTYIIAQFLIIKGLIIQDNNESMHYKIT